MYTTHTILYTEDECPEESLIQKKKTSLKFIPYNIYSMQYVRGNSSHTDFNIYLQNNLILINKHSVEKFNKYCTIKKCFSNSQSSIETK